MLQLATIISQNKAPFPLAGSSQPAGGLGEIRKAHSSQTSPVEPAAIAAAWIGMEVGNGLGELMSAGAFSCGGCPHDVAPCTQAQ